MAPSGDGDISCMVCPLTLCFGKSPVTEGTLRRMGESWQIDVMKTEPPKDRDKVVIFQDQFSTRLHFPLDPFVICILK